MTSGATSAFAPIAIFAYNRRDLLEGLWGSLQGCEGFEQSPVFVFVDGPRTEDQCAAVEEVREFVAGLEHPQINRVFAEENKGLKASIYAGVTAVLAEHEHVIVLEDDLVLSPIALTYFNRFLRHYADEKGVWSIAGYLYDAPALRESRRSLSLPFPHPWGWATWRRAWSRFQLDGGTASTDLSSRQFRKAFDVDGLYPFSLQLENSIKGRVSSWYIHWYYTVFRNGGRSIFPPRRVVDNLGLRDGTHGGSLNPQDWLVSRPPLLEVVPEFCDPAHEDGEVLDLLRNCREIRVQRLIARVGSFKRMFKRK